MKNSRLPALGPMTSPKKMKSWSKNVWRLSARKNAPPLHCFSAGSGLVTRARRARNLTLDEAARMTKIRPARLAEIEADDFSQFPSLAYAKGFLLIYGKFLDVDVT